MPRASNRYPETSDRCDVVINATDAAELGLLGAHPGFTGVEALAAAAQAPEEVKVSDPGLHAATSWLGAGCRNAACFPKKT